MKKLFKILGLSLLGAAVFLLLLAGATQTQFFRDRLREFALSRLDSLLDAEVQLGTVTGNLVSGFSIDHISIKVNGTHLLVAQRLDIRYHLFEIPGKTISIDDLSLIKPSITLLRETDGLWNFERMMRPTPEDTAASGPFDWTLRIRRFRIEEGTFILLDSAALIAPDHGARDAGSIEYHDIALRDISLETSLTVSATEKHAVIANFGFRSDLPPFELRQLTGDFRVMPGEAQVTDMVLKTAGSDIEMDARMRGVDLFGGVDLADLQRKPVNLSLSAYSVDFTELQRFLPPLAFLGTGASLSLKAEGEFGEIAIRQLDLRTGTTQLHFTGSLYNLHDPSRLYLNVKLDRGILSYNDVMALLPGIPLPDLRSLGTTQLNLQFTGTPLDFATSLDLVSEAGSVRSEGTLKIGGQERLRYKGTAIFRALDLARVTKDAGLSSRLNGSATIDGFGTSIATLNGRLEAQLDSSELARRRIDRIRLTVAAEDRRLTTEGTVTLGSMSATLRGDAAQLDSPLPSFTLSGSATHLNMNELLVDAESESDLTFSLWARGRGFTIPDFTGEAAVNLAPSRFRDHLIDSSAIHLSISRGDSGHTRVEITSNVADLSLEGTFETGYLNDLLRYEILQVRKAVGERFVSLDPGLGADVNQQELDDLALRLSSAHRTLDATFHLRVKNLEPVSIVTNNRVFDGTGTLTGKIQGGVEALALEARFAVDDFFYGSADSGLLMQDGRIMLEISSLKPGDPLKEVACLFSAEARRMHLNRRTFDSLMVNFKYEQEYSSYSAQCNYEGSSRLIVKGFSNILDDFLVFTLNEFQVAYKEFRWRADGGATVAFGPRGIRIKNMTMRRDTETVRFAGEISDRDTLEATLSASSLNMEDLRYLLAREELDPRHETFTGVADVAVTARGALNAPLYSATLNARHVSFRGVPLGTVNGRLAYGDQMVSIHLQVESPDAARAGHPDLTVDGTIPVDLSLAGSIEAPADRPMNLDVRSDGIQIGILDPLLPTFNELSGIMRCQVSIGGSTTKPDYRGRLSVDSSSFLFAPNLINYSMRGEFEFQGERILVKNAVLQSRASDDQFRRAGRMDVTGDFALRNFVPSDFNLTADGSLLVVRETTRKSTLSVYGNLFVETGEGGLRYTGEIEQSHLKGFVVVTNSSLIFPPTQQVVDEQFSNTVPVRMVDDTAKAEAAAQRSLATRYFGSQDRFGEARGSEGGEFEPAKSFVDGIRYGLDIDCAGGNTEIRMIFNSATNEELLAAINGQFSMTEDGRTWVGTLSINRAYYRFIKQFNAEGTIKYTGNFLNPELDITATYEGTRTSVDTASETRSEKVIVSMKITGTRYAPKLDWSMTIDDVDYYSYEGPKSSDVQTDALAFILAGTFPLSKSQANDVAADLGPTARSSLVTGASSLFTKAISEFLRKETGIIHSVELSYGTQSSFGQAADIRLSGVAAGGIWRYGGKILTDPFSNANVSLLYSLGSVFDKRSLRNFMLELDRRVEITTIGETSEKKQVNSARLFYRFSF